MNGPGSILQHERLMKKLTLDRVHRETKIKMEYLEAIEHDDVSAFPAELYYKNFLKTYSKYLYLDAAEMINIYEQVKIEKYQEHLRLNKKDSLKEKLSKFYDKYKRIIVVGSIFLAVFLVVFVIAKIVNNINIAIPDVDEIDGYMQNTVVSQQIFENQNDEIKEDKVQEQAAVQVSEQSNEEENVSAEEEQPKEEKSKEELKKTVQPKPQEITLQINAKRNTWVKLYSDNRTSFEGILQKGHHYTSKAKNKFSLKVGDTEGVEVYFNDEFFDISDGESKVRTIEFKRD